MQNNRLTHLFWMSPNQVEIASGFNYLTIHDNTHNCNMYLHLGCFTTINEQGISLLVAQGLVLRERDCDYPMLVFAMVDPHPLCCRGPHDG